MTDMTPEAQQAYREAQERLERQRAEYQQYRDAERARALPPDDLRARVAAMLASMPVLTPEQIEAEERKRAEAEEQRAKAEHARRRRDAVESLGDLPIAREMLEPIVDGSVGDSAAISAVRSWYESKGKPVLMLLGGVGSGKTVAAGWLLARITMTERSASARYVKMRDVANLYRAGFGDDAKAFADVIKCGLLVIDELTTERDADLGRAALHEVIDERGTRRRPTLLLANRTKDEIRERYDARTIDRLRECAVVVTVGAKSMRKGAW